MPSLVHLGRILLALVLDPIRYNNLLQVQPRPALAVGVIDATDEIQTTAYFVASKSLSRMLKIRDKEITNPRVHVGIGGGRLDGLFAGASVVLRDKLMLMAEYDTRDINLGARLAVGHGIRVHAGWIHGLDDLAVGASFNKVF